MALRRVTFMADDASWTKLRLFARAKGINRTTLVNALFKAFTKTPTTDTVEATLITEVQNSFYNDVLKRTGRA